MRMKNSSQRRLDKVVWAELELEICVGVASKETKNVPKTISHDGGRKKKILRNQEEAKTICKL